MTGDTLEIIFKYLEILAEGCLLACWGLGDAIAISA